MATALEQRFPLVKLSAGWIKQWAGEHLVWQRKKAEDVRAIDDVLEQNAALFEELFANDPPAKRKKACEILAQVHANTETESTALRPQLPSGAIPE